MKSILFIAFISTLILLGASSALAQTHRGSVRGTVYDSNRAVVLGATITLTSQESSETRTTTSGDEGGYALSSLRPGRYRMTVSAPNFATFPHEFTLLVNQELRVDAELQPQGIIHPYGIVTAPDDVKRETASQGAVIENRQVEGLPLDGRNFFELALLVPGAVTPAQGSAIRCARCSVSASPIS